MFLESCVHLVSHLKSLADGCFVASQKCSLYYFLLLGFELLQCHVAGYQVSKRFDLAVLSSSSILLHHAQNSDGVLFGQLEGIRVNIELRSSDVALHWLRLLLVFLLLERAPGKRLAVNASAGVHSRACVSENREVLRHDFVEQPLFGGFEISRLGAGRKLNALFHQRSESYFEGRNARVVRVPQLETGEQDLQKLARVLEIRVRAEQLLASALLLVFLR